MSGLNPQTTESERRPSFPQGGLNWRLRQNKSEDRSRRLRRSLGAHDENGDGEKEEDGGTNLFPESMPCCECAYHPMTHFDPQEHSDAKNANSTGHVTANSGGSPRQHLPGHNDNCGSAMPRPCDVDKKTGSCSCSDLRHSSVRKCCGNHRCPSHIGGCRGYFDTSRNQRRSTKETVVINVGGQIFETYRSTLRRLKTPIFNSEQMFRSYYRKTHGDYFFDRDPMAFGSVLNFLRTGELHIPTNMCGPALQNELEFWGMEELDIARCCWTQYNTWKTQCRSLEKLEYDRKFSTTQHYNDVNSDSSCWYRIRSHIWTFLQDPASSRKAKIYAWISIIFVFISIFSFCAETHPIFKVKARDMIQFASFYEFFNLQSIQWDELINRTLTQSAASNASLNMSDSDVASNHENDHHPYHINNNDFYDVDYMNDNGEDDIDDIGNKELPHPALLMMDVACLMFFTLEYLTRFLCSPNKLNFVRALQNIVDILAFAPDYVELLFLAIDPSQHEGMDIMEMLFILRILRLFRIFRLIRHVPGLWILLYTLKASFNELMLMFVFLIIGMVVFATLIHFVEPDGGFSNIPVGFWWSVVTMTTVGYGDMYPQSAAGYAIGSCCAVAGLLMIAFTVPIIVSNFVLYYTHVQYGLARKDREAEKQREEAEEEELRAKIESKCEDPETGNCYDVADSKDTVSSSGQAGERRPRESAQSRHATNSTTTINSGSTTANIATITRNGISYTGLINSDEENIEMNECSPLA